MTTKTIHWLGAGLSSGPGIRQIADAGHSLVLWNRTKSKAEEVFSNHNPGSNVQVRTLDWKELHASLKKGDIVVSMLPAPMHPEIAGICIENGAHLVTTSYVSEAMKAHHLEATSKNVSLINECGLDPGIDHLFAHLLVQDYNASKEFDPSNEIEFRSYCGGIPKVPNEFRYKFSWSPAGVLRALKNQAKSIEDGSLRTTNRAWEAVTPYSFLGESFEVYPNRDSTPYLKEYGFNAKWNVKTFVRGTIRLNGWKDAWASIFSILPEASDQTIENTSAALWNEHQYLPGEEDRVVLYVELLAKRGGKTVYSRYYALDESGSGSDTAMARLVSLPATLAVESIFEGEAPIGVSGAPHNPAMIQRWLGSLESKGVQILSN